MLATPSILKNPFFLEADPLNELMPGSTSQYCYSTEAIHAWEGFKTGHLRNFSLTFWE